MEKPNPSFCIRKRSFSDFKDCYLRSSKLRGSIEITVEPKVTISRKCDPPEYLRPVIPIS